MGVSESASVWVCGLHAELEITGQESGARHAGSDLAFGHLIFVNNGQSRPHRQEVYICTIPRSTTPTTQHSYGSPRVDLDGASHSQFPSAASTGGGSAATLRRELTRWMRRWSRLRSIARSMMSRLCTLRIE